MNKYKSQKEARIGLFLEIIPKLTLWKVLKQKIDHIFLWLDLDNEDTKQIIKETSPNNNTSQEIVISALEHPQKNLV